MTAAVLLPAIFGLIGTVVGGVLTMIGQARAEQRAQERRREEHYGQVAHELIAWLRERSNLLSMALAYSGERSHALAQKAFDMLPVSDFTLRAQAAFPFLSAEIEAYSAYELKLMQILKEIAEEERPFASYDEAHRHAFLERLVVLQRPLLAGFAEVISQLSIEYPRRLQPNKVAEKAQRQR